MISTDLEPNNEFVSCAISRRVMRGGLFFELELELELLLELELVPVRLPSLR